MQRKIIVMFCLLLGVSVGAGAAQPAAAPAKTAPQARGALYKLEYAGNTSWLFGTIHVGTPDFFPLEPRVTQALESATAVALEIDPAADPARSMAVMREYGLYAAGGGSAMTDIRPEYRPRLERMLKKHGISQEMVAPMKPWLIVMMITIGEYRNLGYRPELGVDLQLARSAHGRKQRIVELESVSAQASLFGRLTKDEQARFLEDSLDTFEDPTQGVQPRDLLDAWASADAAKFEALAREVEEDKTFSGKFMKQVLLNERNPVLADGIVEMMKKEQHSFAAIGTLHLVGTGNVAELLRRRGVKVERIY
ncbi:TraB/GumN family protein [Pseudoduganella violaceinigra]|uniref:TraB/GumN family protein n=1 Tax=Pseudoduganella violaceinigra TaxID=246602 RepID=UPI00041CC52E|nr:TraB/GumN family protein [Pseudoduganella violaceinigra]